MKLKIFFDKNYMKGLSGIFKTAIDTVLGNASVGEYESTDMFIVWHNNALLRYDIYCYRWNFSAPGVIVDTEGVTGSFMCKRVVDLTKTDPQVLTWAITRQAKDSDAASEDIDTAMKMLDKVIDFKIKLKQKEAGKEDET